MGRVHEEINEAVGQFLAAQPVFFVATAPRDEAAHLNLSPKGLAGTFVVLGPSRVAYLDLTGSGIETVAHLRENGRIVLMFCAFAGPPRIVRLYGRGEVVLPGSAGFEELSARFPGRPGVRSVVRVEVERVADSCGYGVPRLSYVDDRPDLDRWAARQGEDGIATYQATRNATSIDGLPGLAGLQ